MSKSVIYCRSDATTVALGSHLQQDISPYGAGIARAASKIWEDCELPITPSKPALAAPESWDNDLEPVVTPEHLKPGYKNDWILSEVPPSPPDTPKKKEAKWMQYAITPEHPDFHKGTRSPSVAESHWNGQDEDTEHEGSDQEAAAATQATVHYEAEDMIDRGAEAPATPTKNLTGEGSDKGIPVKNELDEEGDMADDELDADEAQEPADQMDCHEHTGPKQDNEHKDEKPHDGKTNEPPLLHIKDQMALRKKKKHEALEKAAAKSRATLAKATEKCEATAEAKPIAKATSKAKAKAKATAQPDHATEEVKAAKKRGWPKGKAKSKPKKAEGDSKEEKEEAEIAPKAKAPKRKSEMAENPEPDGDHQNPDDEDPDYKPSNKRVKKGKCLVTDKQKQHLKSLPCMFQQFVSSVIDADAVLLLVCSG